MRKPHPLGQPGSRLSPCWRGDPNRSGEGKRGDPCRGRVSPLPPHPTRAGRGEETPRSSSGRPLLEEAEGVRPALPPPLRTRAPHGRGLGRLRERGPSRRSGSLHAVRYSRSRRVPAEGTASPSTSSYLDGGPGRCPSARGSRRRKEPSSPERSSGPGRRQLEAGRGAAPPPQGGWQGVGGVPPSPGGPSLAAPSPASLGSPSSGGAAWWYGRSRRG